MGQKKKKEKPIYVDDGSTVADMSSLTGKPSAGEGKGERNGSGKRSVPRSAMRDQLRTFTDAQKMMFLPMLAVLGILALAFLIIYFLL
ncbi:MAG: hypothetical protein IJX80_05615 [Clostridia bacterium]|nr:hypothetical protein [Clostridia bacterium]